MNLKPCPFCKTPIPEDCVYCDICGAKLHKCPSCGAFAKSQRCTKCGHPTVELEPTVPQNSQATDVYQNVGQASVVPVTVSDCSATVRPGMQTMLLKPGHLVCVANGLRLGLCHEAVIGRNGSYGTALAQFRSISGRHARLLDVENGWQIEDIGSSFGTFLNGVELGKNQPTRITVGDILRFADIDFRVTE